MFGASTATLPYQPLSLIHILRGRILEAACREILGGEDIKLATDNGQEWYDSYKAHIARLYELNGENFLKERTEYPQFLSFLIKRTESSRADTQLPQ